LSFFQLRDSLQELVRSVIESYWQVVFARPACGPRNPGQQSEERSIAEALSRKAGPTSKTCHPLRSSARNLIASRQFSRGWQPACSELPTEPFHFSRHAAHQRNPLWLVVVTGVAQIRRPDLIELKLISKPTSGSSARNQRRPN
jgi:hypothetical protein